MQLSSKDPDVQTILAWITDNRIDLQPDFQRGEVWNTAKKQLLIDTILRNWQMPPIFIIVDDALLAKDVLDGHQRLTTINQFFRGEFPVDGFLHPQRADLNQIDGRYFRDLPERQRRRFLDFSIRVFEISNHERDEPFELFYRLNEGVKLTPAERRNTFYGALRGQVKDLVEFWDHIGLGTEDLGFANARLAYHDVIARILILLEKRGLNRKLTDKEITERYRDEVGASERTVLDLRGASVALVRTLKNPAIQAIPARYRRFSKPTLFSVLYFCARRLRDFGSTFNENQFAELLSFIFRLQAEVSFGVDLTKKRGSDQRLLYQLFDFYKYRSSTSVNDARALIIRDFFISFVWDLLGYSENYEVHSKVDLIISNFAGTKYNGEDVLYDLLQDFSWGME